MNKIVSFFKRSGRFCSFEQLLAPHIDRLYRQAYKYCGREHEAEELLQEVLIECHEREQQLREAAAPAAWLSRLLYHRFVDRYRKQKRRDQNEIGLIVSEALVSSSSLENDYLHQQILDALDYLSAEQRMVVSLHDLEGHTLSEIALIVEMPIGTLKSHLHRARKVLKKVLQLQPSELAVR